MSTPRPIIRCGSSDDMKRLGVPMELAPNVGKCERCGITLVYHDMTKKQADIFRELAGAEPIWLCHPCCKDEIAEDVPNRELSVVLTEPSKDELRAALHKSARRN